MKNIHVLKTDKPSKLYFNHNKEFEKYQFSKEPFINGLTNTTNQHIYITSSDEEIKDGDYYLYLKDNSVQQFIKKHHTKLLALDIQKKIILTTDQDLIKDGVQAIDDDFLEWFVKNPSCERVEVEKIMECEKCGKEHCDNLQCRGYKDIPYYKIIIPKEEPKQETLEEVAKKYAELSYYGDEVDAFVRGAKWQAERMYSEEEVLELLNKFEYYPTMYRGNSESELKEWLEQFKKK